MDKGIGFNRHLHLPWLDATAVFCAETADSAELRARLEPVLAQDLAGVEARRKTIDLLLNIWVRTGEISPTLHHAAVQWSRMTAVPGDRLWLHYGLTLLYYPFFRACTAAIGQFGRFETHITRKMVEERLVSDRGQIGSIKRASGYVLTSLHRWDILQPEKQYTYTPRISAFTASAIDVETWLLACALHAHPAEEIPFVDLLRLPELFPFHFTVDLGQIRSAQWFDVQRQGAGWDMVRLRMETITAQP